MTLSMILATISVIGVIVTVIYYFAIQQKEKDKSFKDTWVFNSMTQYTKSGSALGKLKDRHEKDGWTAVEFYPGDVDLKKLEKEGKMIKSEVIFLPNNNLNWINKNAWSKDCGILELIPIREDDMSQGLKDSCIGHGFMFISATKENERFDAVIKEARNKNVKMIGKDIDGLEAVKTWKQTWEEGISRQKEEEPKKK